MKRPRLRNAEVRALRDKYERMLALRRAHDRARVDPSYVEPDPRSEMRSLATVYPGVLREIDRIAVAEIERRIAALRDVEHALDPTTEPWMIAQSLFHSFARGALETKRWLRGKKRITTATRASFLTEMEPSADAHHFVDDLAIVASPPRGRLMDVVFTKLADALHVTEAEARLLVFGGRERG